jgi:hypothetical protein
VFSPYVVYLRDSDLSRMEEITEYTELEMRLVFAGVSSWILDIPADNESVANIMYGRGIVIERAGQVILSGPIEHISQEWSSSTHTLQIAGRDDTVLLADRLALPVTSGPPYNASAYDVQYGLASATMRSYVTRNIGPTAAAARQQAGLVLETPHTPFGATVTGSARFDNLLELLQSLARAGGELGFRVVQSSTAAQLVFQVYQPVDRTAEVIFSPKLGNLKAYRYTADIAEANYIYVAGSGEGTSRVFHEQGDTDSQALFGRRIESFRDRRDTSVTAELQQTAAEELLQKASKSSLAITPIDTEGLTFAEDYNLGDKVTVEADSRTLTVSLPPAIVIQDIVREIRISVRADGETIEPSIGTPESGRADIFSLFNRLNRAESRILNIERR